MSDAAAILSQLRERLALLEASEHSPAATLATLQAERLATVAAHHAQHSPAFAARLAAAGLTAAELPGALHRLPPLTRRDLQRDPGHYARIVPAEDGPVNETRTSGSTGEPVVVRRTFANQLDWMAATMRDHRWNRRDLSGRFAAIMRLDGVQRLPDWGPPAALLAQTGPALGIPMTVPLDEQMTLLRAFRPTSLLVYTSNLAGLLDRIEAGETLPDLRDIRTVSSIVTPALRARTRALTGIAIADIYSSEENGFIALQCPISGLYHVMAETVLVEIVREDGTPCAPGETGRVIVTDLVNRATALIRYANGDWAEAAGPCPCGRTLPTIGAIRGRTRNLMTHADGGRSWPYLASIDHRSIAPVVQYQYVQHARDLIEVRLVTERPLTGGEEDALAALIRARLGFPFHLDFTYPGERLDRPAAKFEEFLNRIDPE
ncbi:phenylacetate--CoA ligase family protein [Sphingomonas jatrophae]|uniref:phenylacetate--CoA ligase family protein n=1 Tax=Sphingomonas jatrophae TaxID=1166337 RepID=UPI0010420172|nr:phenylacetate--CoA ligase family protein [Sphingomonas jatrophae]